VTSTVSALSGGKRPHAIERTIAERRGRNGPSRSRAAQRFILNDASRLSPTPVAKHVSIVKPQAFDNVIARVRADVKEAHAEKRPVAASVARHSMGGQCLARDGTAISLDGGPLEMDTR